MDVFAATVPPSRALLQAASLFREFRRFGATRERLQAQAYIKAWLQEHEWALGALAEPCVEGVLDPVTGDNLRVVLVGATDAAPYALISADYEPVLYDAVDALIHHCAIPGAPAVRVSPVSAWASPAPSWAAQP